MVDSDSDGGDTFATRLQRLFDVVARPAEQGGGRYSVAEVAEAVGVSRQHMNDLKAGKKQKPSWELVTSIAKFFGVSIVYFGEDEAAADYARQLELLAALQQGGVEDIALRSGQLSPQHREVLLNLAQQLSTLEDSEDPEK